MPESSNAVMTWWTCLTAIAIFNICLLIFSRWLLHKKLPDFSLVLKRIRNWQFRLSAVYVLGCGFRSVVPREDVDRTVLLDSWISSIAIGRSVATIAELCFVAQWAWLLYEIGKHTGNKTILTLSKLLVPIIFVAEIFSWYACITTNYLGTAIEESLWALAASLLVIGLVLALPHYFGKQLTFLKMAIVAGVGYVVYMVTVDVPTYVLNWMAGETSGKEYSTIKQGLWEVVNLRIHSHAYEDWKYAMIWMTLYFSVAVWMSLYMINSPRMDENLNQ